MPKLTQEAVNNIVNKMDPDFKVEARSVLEPSIGKILSLQEIIDLLNSHQYINDYTTREYLHHKVSDDFYNLVGKEKEEEKKQQEREERDRLNKEEADRLKGQRQQVQLPKDPTLKKIEAKLLADTAQKVESKIRGEKDPVRARPIKEYMEEAFPSWWRNEAFPLKQRNDFLGKLNRISRYANPHVRKDEIAELVEKTFNAKGDLTPEQVKKQTDEIANQVTGYKIDKDAEHQRPFWKLDLPPAQNLQDYAATQNLQIQQALIDKNMRRMHYGDEQEMYPLEDRFADPTEKMKTARQKTADLATSPIGQKGMPYLQKALDQSTADKLATAISDIQGKRGEIYGRQKNEYQDDVVKSLKHYMMENWRENIEPNLTAQMIGKGLFGSNVHNSLKDTALLKMNESLSHQIAKLLHQNSESAKERTEREVQNEINAEQLKAQAEFQKADQLRQGAQQMDNMAEQNLKTAVYQQGLLNEIGKEEQAEEQKKKDYEYKHHREQESSKDKGEAILQELAGKHAPGTHYQEQQRQYTELLPPMKSPLAQFGNMMQSVVGAYMMSPQNRGLNLMSHKKGGSAKAYGLGGMVQKGYAQGGYPTGTPSEYKLQEYANYLTQPGINPIGLMMMHAGAQGLANPYEFGSFGKGLQQGLKAASEERQHMADRHYKAAHIHNLVEESRSKQADREQNFKLHQENLKFKNRELNETSRYHSGMLENKALEDQLRLIKLQHEIEQSKGKLSDFEKAQLDHDLKTLDKEPGWFSGPSSKQHTAAQERVNALNQRKNSLASSSFSHQKTPTTTQPSVEFNGTNQDFQNFLASHGVP